jgi:hypothetical protein
MSEPLDLTQFEGHTEGPWELWTGCSWRRFWQVGTCGTVCEPTVARDGHPDLIFRNGGQDGPDASLIAAAPRLLAEIPAAEKRGRLAALREALEAVLAEHLEGYCKVRTRDRMEEDVAYDGGVDDCADAIRRLLEKEGV